MTNNLTHNSRTYPTFINAFAVARELVTGKDQLNPLVENFIANIEQNLDRSPDPIVQREAISAVWKILLATGYIMENRTANPPWIGTAQSTVHKLLHDCAKFWRPKPHV